MKDWSILNFEYVREKSMVETILILWRDLETILASENIFEAISRFLTYRWVLSVFFDPIMLYQIF